MNPELRLLNSYDTAWPFVVDLGAYRLRCSNGLVIGKGYLYLRKRHVFELDQIRLQDRVSAALERFDKETSTWKRWAQRPLTEQVYSQVFGTMELVSLTGIMEPRMIGVLEPAGRGQKRVSTTWPI